MPKLVFLGRLEDVAGQAELDVAEGALADILAALDPQLAIALSGDRIRMAHNGTLVVDRGAITLQGGDELAFLPPVSGG